MLRWTFSARDAQALDLAVDDAVVDREHVARAVDQRVDAPVPTSCASRRRRGDAVSRSYRPCSRSTVTLERVRLRVVERQLRDLGRRAA